MSIATRIEAIEEHLTDDYSVLELAGADLTNVDKNIFNLKPTWKERLLYYINYGTDVVWDNWEKVVAEGTSLTLNNTEEAPMKIDLKGNTSQETITGEVGTEVQNTSISVNDLNTSKESYVTLKGNTYQDSTTGKNLIDGANPTSANSATVSMSGNVITVSSTSTNTSPFARYEFDNIQTGDVVRLNGIIKSSNGRFAFQEYTGSWTTKGAVDYSDGTSISSLSYTIPSGTTAIRFLIYASKSVPTGASQCSYENVIVTINNSDMTYEEYTGGNPAPNPNYPMPVHTVSGDNKIKIGANSNLQGADELYQRMYDYNPNYVSETTDGNVNVIRFYSQNYRPVGTGFEFTILDKWKENTRYTIRVMTKKQDGNALYLQALYTDGTTSNKQISGSTTDYTELRFVTESGKTVERIGFSFGTAGYWLLDKSSWYVGEGVQTEYPEYKGTTYPINLPVENKFNINGTYNNTACTVSVSDNELTQTNSGQYSRTLWTIDNLTIGQNYTLSFSYNNSGASSIEAMIRNSADSSTIANTTLTTNTNGTETLTFTATETTHKIRFYSNITNTSNTSIVKFSNIQLEKGNKKNSFNPYGSTPIELCKIDTYQDRFFKSNGKWYLHNDIGKYRLPNNIGGYNASANWYYFGITNLSIDINTTTLICNYFKYYEHLVGTETTEGIGYSSNYSNLLIRNSNCTSAEEYRTWLTNNEVYIYYVLATPTNTEVTNETLVSQLEALYNATTYSTTNINTVTNDLLPYIDFRYNVVTQKPSPDRPSDVNVVSGDNTIEVATKNVLEDATWYNGRIESDGTVNTSSSWRYCDYIDISKGNWIFKSYVGATAPKMAIYNQNKEFISSFTLGTSTIVDLSQYNGYYLRTSVDIETGINNKELLYQSTTYPINLGEYELCKIGDYQDRFFKSVEGDSVYDSLDSATKSTLDTNEWYLEKKIGKITYTGSEANWQIYQPNPNIEIYQLYIANSNSLHSTTEKNAMSYYFIPSVIGGRTTIFNTVYTYASGIAFNPTGITTIADFKTWLSTHNTTVYYVLSTPTYTKIEGTLKEQLEVVKKSYDNQTNISQTNSDLPFELSVTALKEM